MKKLLGVKEIKSMTIKELYEQSNSCVVDLKGAQAIREKIKTWKK